MKTILTIILVLAAASALAGPSTVFNYQGFVSDLGGSPLDGAYDLTFRIYEVDAGADPALWTEVHSGVQVTDGVFSVLLGSLTVLPPAVLGSAELYIGVTVGTDDEIAPRLQVTSTPWAYRAAIADSAVVTGTGGGDGGTVTSVGTGAGLTGGPITTSGTIGVATGGITGTMIADGTITGTDLDTKTITSNEIAFNTITAANIATDGVGLDEIAPASVGSSEVVDNSLTYLDIGPNAVGASELAEDSVWNSEIADNAVGSDEIANNAVFDSKILDEPGVASISNVTLLDLTATPADVTSRTISTPTSGYVVAIANAYGLMPHDGVSSSRITLSISQTSATHNYSNDVVEYIDSDLPAATYRMSMNVSDVFPVNAAGSFTFYLVAHSIDGDSNDVHSAGLVLMFFPTSYGSVTKIDNPTKDPGGE